MEEEKMIRFKGEPIFKVGDLVELKSGSPAMVVTYIRKDGCFDDSYQLHWMNKNNELQVTRLREEVLKRA